MDSSFETERFAILQSYAVLDSPPEPRFDRITRLAAGTLNTPFAVVSLADKNRHWFKSRCGVSSEEMSRHKSFCNYTISGADCFVVLDATCDERFATADVVAGPPHVRFYAGAPLMTPSGVAIGSLCVLDTEPHDEFSPSDAATLADLASTVVELLESRAREAELTQRTRDMRLTAGILRLISDAPSWDKAIEGVLATICAHHGAALGSLWRLSPDGRRAVLLHAYDGGLPENGWYRDFCTQTSFETDSSLVARCLSDLSPGYVDYRDPLSVDFEHMVATSAIMRARVREMCQRGLPLHVCQPVQVGGDTFAFVLVFNEQPRDVRAISNGLDRLTDTLKPALYRRVSEDHMRLLFENNPIPMWVFDAGSLAFLEVNEAATRKYGLSREAFLRTTLLEIAPPDIEPGLRERVSQKPESFVQFGPVRHRLASGQEIQTMVARHDVLFGGRLARLAALWDVTEVEQARSELRLNHERLERLTDQLRTRTDELTEAHRVARLGTWRWIIASSAVEWSDEVFRIAGREPGCCAMTYDSTFALIHPEDRPRIEEKLSRAIASKGASEDELRVMLPDGGVRHCWANAHAVLDEHGDVIEMRGVIQDISERKEAELALFRSEKLLTIGQLTGGIAHDFNNLLMVVSSNLEDALERLPPADPMQDVLGPALQATMRGKELTSQLLSYARRQSLRPERLWLHTYLAGFHPLLQRAIGERYRLTFSADPDLWACTVDPAQLEHAVMNLIINARDAMPQGGQLAIDVANARIRAPCPRAGKDELAPGNYVRLAVKDNGHGMPAHVARRAFEPFFTTKPLGSGSGLGLSMVYGFAKQSGGHVIISSEPGHGTTVELYFPADVHAVARPAPREAPIDWHAGSRTALLVEDQEPVLRVVERMLTTLGFTVTTARTAQEALAQLALPEPFDLLFTDVVLPGSTDGVALAARAAARHPAMKVLLTSGYTDHAVNGELAGGSELELLTKPFRRRDLTARLRHMFADA